LCSAVIVEAENDGEILNAKKESGSWNATNASRKP
jgi:hypothetical protein